MKRTVWVHLTLQVTGRWIQPEWRTRTFKPCLGLTNHQINPIENLWKLIKLEMEIHKPKSKASLFEYVQQEWAAVSAERYQKLVESCSQDAWLQSSQTMAIQSSTSSCLCHVTHGKKQNKKQYILGCFLYYKNTFLFKCTILKTYLQKHVFSMTVILKNCIWKRFSCVSMTISLAF